MKSRAKERHSDKGAEFAGKADEALRKTSESADMILGVSIQVATATEEQSNAVADINRNIVPIWGRTVDASYSAQKNSAASNEVTQQAQCMRCMSEIKKAAYWNSTRPFVVLLCRCCAVIRAQPLALHPCRRRCRGWPSLY